MNTLLETVGLRRGAARSAGVALPAATLLSGLLRRRPARVGLVLLGVVVAFIVTVPVLSPHGVYAQDGVQLQAPSRRNWFGTDQVGRDLLVRLADGGRRSLGGALLALIIAGALGILIGTLAGSAGKVVDTVVMRAIDAMNGLPPLVVPIALVGALGASYTNLLIAIVISYVPSFARISRTIVGSLRHRLDIVAAQLMGVPRWRVAVTHVLPTVLVQMLVIATLDVGKVIVSLSALSFLGMGAQAPTPEWGVLLGDGQMFFTPAPWLLVGPAVTITMVIIGSNLVGEALRDVIAERNGT